MADQRIRVGFIGLNPDSHWAATAHLPALQSLSDKFTIVGVANSSQESAQRTASALGLPHAFADAEALVNSPDIDLVVVTVKVPHHLQLVTAALNAGKHVYCEWPLGNGLAEARELAKLAKEKGVVAVAGTQARAALEIEHLSQLVKDGFVGKVLSTTLIGSGGNWAGETIDDYYYLFDNRNGANMQTIPLAHTFAAMRDVLGEFGSLDARFISQFDAVTVTDTGETRPKTVPDQILVQGTLASGAALSVHYRGGVSRGTNLLWEINGTEGDIQVTGGLGHAQMIQLTVKGAKGAQKELELLMPAEDDYQGWPESATVRNVARMYTRLYQDIETGSRLAPNFEDAVSLHEIIDTIEQSASQHES
ncbi:Gfo/Idh/MocA family protein [Vibrio mangrovi]|uniref:1,5-anhydro-D-fructose reductase n=1 Tax=Vibrio mangrovi TaxID=474394 RepID=A0A1Y6IMX5_9VIBR|nr:Gfo/Idh/MocA family oxidoreductase [Vibrio mangrovi]MDW6004216.1 Gfo/Idh/MocA family oxidoreductase [Vibrio mangrovi]SMR98986.1 1,5-anhydro-D-fructose reductase [Vibrio mangrovi]